MSKAQASLNRKANRLSKVLSDLGVKNEIRSELHNGFMVIDLPGTDKMILTGCYFSVHTLDGEMIKPEFNGRGLFDPREMDDVKAAITIF